MEQEKKKSSSNRGEPMINGATQLTDFKKTHIPKQKCFFSNFLCKTPGGMRPRAGCVFDRNFSLTPSYFRAYHCENI